MFGSRDKGAPQFPTTCKNDESAFYEQMHFLAFWVEKLTKMFFLKLN